jgi:hypothetical protein
MLSLIIHDSDDGFEAFILTLICFFLEILIWPLEHTVIISVQLDVCKIWQTFLTPNSLTHRCYIVSLYLLLTSEQHYHGVLAVNVVFFTPSTEVSQRLPSSCSY